MTDRVIDASVAFKWLVEETHSVEAQALLRTTSVEGSQLLAPPHFPSEVSNAVYRRTLRGDEYNLPEMVARVAVARLLSIPVQILNPRELYQQAFAIAIAFSLPSVYDGIYVTLAQLLDLELWTADRRLLNALRGRASWVRWIGDYQA